MAQKRQRNWIALGHNEALGAHSSDMHAKLYKGQELTAEDQTLFIKHVLATAEALGWTVALRRAFSNEKPMVGDTPLSLVQPAPKSVEPEKPKVVVPGR